MQTFLLAGDVQASMLVESNGLYKVTRSYTAYGGEVRNGFHTCLGYDGERYDPLVEGYHLGRGYRLYNPQLMRFVSPDSLSPFQRGGLNSYAAFGNHPIGWTDPDGRAPQVKRNMQYYRNEGSANRKLSQAVEARGIVEKKHGLGKIPILEDSQPEEYQQYLDQFNGLEDVAASSFQVIASKCQVQSMKGPHKFVFTRHGELITGSESAVNFAHPMLNYFSEHNPGVISAGYIYWSKRGLQVSDYSGHYYLSAAGRVTAEPVITYLSALGLKATLVRSRGLMPR